MKKALVLSLMFVMALGFAAFADTTVTNWWNLESGVLNIDVVTLVGPSNIPGLIDPVVTNVDITGYSVGNLVSETTTYVGALYYGTYILDSQTLEAHGFNQSQGIEFSWDAEDDVYGLNPTNGVYLEASSEQGNYVVSVETRNCASDTESAFNANMAIPGSGGSVRVYIRQDGTTIHQDAELWLGTNGAGVLNVMKPTAYCQYLANTILADMSATGAGGYYVWAETDRPMGMDVNAKGTVDVSQTSEINADNIVGVLGFNGGFTVSMDYANTVPLNLESGPGKGAYWPALPRYTSTGILIDFRGTNDLDVPPSGT